MSARAVRTHYLQTLMSGRLGSTDCGIVSSRSSNSDTEAETIQGFRIDVTRDEARVTCLRCRKLRNLPLNGSDGKA